MRKDVSNEIIRNGGENINKSEMARIMGCSRKQYIIEKID